VARHRVISVRSPHSPAPVEELAHVVEPG
jgi:hypothetical protein